MTSFLPLRRLTKNYFFPSPFSVRGRKDIHHLVPTKIFLLFMFSPYGYKKTLPLLIC